MAIKTIRDISVKGKRVLLRCDFNVPLKGDVITDDTRIKAALPTIQHLLKEGVKALILVSHLGRPKGRPDSNYSLKPVAEALSHLLGKPVKMANDCIGSEVFSEISALEEGGVILLENIRYYKEEEENNPDFSKKLASLADLYVNDAFGSAHRAHASTEGVAHFLPSVGGFLMEKEDNFLGKVLKNPEKPLVAIIGGSKVSSKIKVLESLLSKASAMVIGGGMAYTFLKVQGYGIGKSLYEEEFKETAQSFLKKAQEMNVQVILPEDHIVSSEFSETAEAKVVNSPNIPEGLMGMDIGEKTLKKIENTLSLAKTIVWNGPMGVFEFDKFSNGTKSVAEMVAGSSAITVVGGGDSVAAINKFNLGDKISHVSTGGGASLEYLEGIQLPGIKILER